MRKFKFYIFFIIFLLVLFIWGVVGGLDNQSMNFVESLIPTKTKIMLKKTIFTPTNVSKMNEIKAKFNYLVFKPESKSYELKSRSNIYNIRTFPLPLTTNGKWGGKPVAYLEQTDNKIIIASGSGEFFSFEKKDIESENLNLKRIHSNIKDLIINEKFYSDSVLGLRDLLILKNKIFFSFTKEQTKGCYNTSIMVSEINFDYLNFSEFFSYEDCISNENMQQYPYILVYQHAGGRMVSFKDEKIFLTIGDWGNKFVPQDKNSIFGKIISIDLKSKDYEIVAMGHRNPQGLYYDENRNIIISTEHGPTGGDEINIHFNLDNKIVENYGWPISSYGIELPHPYGKEGKFIKESPLYKSHKDHGFIEPIKYYVPSIAISEVIKIPRTFNEKFTNDFFYRCIRLPIPNK